MFTKILHRGKQEPFIEDHSKVAVRRLQSRKKNLFVSGFNWLSAYVPETQASPPFPFPPNLVPCSSDPPFLLVVGSLVIVVVVDESRIWRRGSCCQGRGGAQQLYLETLSHKECCGLDFCTGFIENENTTPNYGELHV